MKRKVLISLITISLLMEGALVYHLFSSSNKVLEEVKIVNLKNDKSIAIMVQDTNTDEWHEASNRDSWPSPTTHGFVGAECSDSEGATIDWEKVLTFSLANKTATIKTKQTAYCTLYFAKGEPALDWLKKKGGETFAGGGDHTTAVDGLYRFKGTTSQVLNNYICFGTVLESECINNAKTYMYRIIGITSEADATIGLYANQLKIIKATPSNNAIAWNSSGYDYEYCETYGTENGKCKWDGVSIKSYLNGTFLNTIVSGIDGTYWESMISNHKWYNADQKSAPGTVELKTSQTAESKVGLMYASDYMNAQGISTSNWLFIKNGWSTNTALKEWTMTRMGYFSGGGYVALSIDTNSKVWLDLAGSLNRDYAVRPVFYLQSGVNLTGEGTKDHPYIIATMNNA